MDEPMTPKVLAYYFPDWHHDRRNAEWFGEGWTEWELVRSALPRFEGHRQPRIPLAGHRLEDSGVNAADDVRLAREYGVDGFLVDYYWYDDGPYLEGALRDGLLAAHNIGDVDFALMWANHDLVDIFPSDTPDSRPSTLKSGAIGRADFDAMVDRVVWQYFSHPSYLKVDGRPWFSIYELGNLIEGLGGVGEARAALEYFDEEARRRGYPGVHLDAVVWGIGVLPEATIVTDPAAVLSELGFRSATSYVWTHHSDLSVNTFPVGDWSKVRADAFDDYATLATQLPVPLYPNVTVGWDASPRTNQAVPFVRGGYPWTPVFDPTPDELERGIRMARDFLDETRPPYPLITINAWNEWTEGSHLLPDSTRGAGYLEAVRRALSLTSTSPSR